MKKILLTGLLVFSLLGGALADDLSDLLPFLGTGSASSDTDMARLEQRLFELEAELSSLENKIAAVEKTETDLAHQVSAFHIKGSTLGQLRRLNISGQVDGSTVDFLGRPLWYDYVEMPQVPQERGYKANQRMAMTIIGKPAPQIEITSDLFASTAWSGSRSMSVDNIAIRTHLGSLYTEAGVFHRAFTPLTLYWQTPTVWFESELFSQLREEYSNELQQAGNLRRLEGLAVDFVQDNLLLQGLYARVRDGNPYHRFLAGFNLNLFPGKDRALSARYVGLKDDPASGEGGIARSDLLGVGFRWTLPFDLIAGGEYVRSVYNKNELTSIGDITDSAIVGELFWSKNNLDVQGRLFHIGPKYYAPTSQSRDYVLADLSVFGPATASTAMGGTVAEAANFALPYGIATPNRTGLQLRASYLLPQTKVALELTGLKELAGASDSGELDPAIDAKRQYLLARVGGSIQLSGLSFGSFTVRQPLEVLGQVEGRLIRRESADEELERDLTTAICDLGIAYEFIPSWKALFGAKFQGDSNAGDKSLHSTLAAGIQTSIGQATSARLVYQYVTCDKNETKAYQGSLVEFVVKSNF